MSASPQQFSRSELGVVRLYPVGRVVLFPHTSEALRISDPKDVVLIEDALAGDRLVALAALAPGWERKRPHSVPVPPAACLARIATWSNDGPAGCNVLLWGIARLRVVEDLGLREGVRRARVELCEDDYPADDAQRARLHDRLLQVLAASSDVLGLGKHATWAAGEHVPLGVLADMVAQSADLPWAEKEALLAECNVHRRVERLLGSLAALAEAPGHWPACSRLAGPPEPN